MARNLNGKGKKPMGTAATKAASTANATDIFVNDLMKISRKFLAGVSVEEREVLNERPGSISIIYIAFVNSRSVTQRIAA